MNVQEKAAAAVDHVNAARNDDLKKGRDWGWCHCAMLCGCCLKTIGVSFDDSNFEMGPAILDSWFQPFEKGKLSTNVLWQKIRQAFFFDLR